MTGLAPPTQCGRLGHYPPTLRSHFEYRSAILRGTTSDHNRDTPSLDQRLELNLPTPGEITQQRRQRVEPAIDDRAAKSPPETTTQLVIKLRDSRQEHHAETSARCSVVIPER